jgi:hypothetical protein
LGRSALYLREKEFWDYHKDGLRNIGIPLSLLELIGASFLEVMDLLLNPKKTVEKIAGRIIQRMKEKSRKTP